MGFFFGRKKAKAARAHRRVVQDSLVAKARAGAIQGAQEDRGEAFDSSFMDGILTPHRSSSVVRTEDGRYTEVKADSNSCDGPNPVCGGWVQASDGGDAALRAEAPISYPSESAPPSHSCSSSSDSSSGSSNSCGGASSCGGGGGGGD